MRIRKNKQRFRTSSRHGRALLFGVGVVVLLLGCLEYAWRRQGHQPASIDNLELWAMARKKVSNPDPDLVVLAGSSRIQSAIDPEVFVRETGMQRPIVLASAMASPLPILRNLAEDEQFRGIVLCSIMPMTAFSASESFTTRPREQIEFFNQVRFSDGIDFSLKNLYHNLLAVSVYNVWTVILPELIIDRPRIEFPGSVNSDRYHTYKSDRLWHHAHQKLGMKEKFWWYSVPPDAEAMKKYLEQYKKVSDQLRAKGVRMLFVRLPADPELLRFEESTFPREKYWERLLEVTGVPGIHSADFPSLQNFRFPDSSHIDGVEKPRFTQEFAPIVSSAFQKEYQ